MAKHVHSLQYTLVSTITTTTTTLKVKRAYRDKCLKLHPDVSASACPEDFVRVTNAYNYLTDASRHNRYRWTTSHGGYGPARPPKQKFSPALVALIIALPLALGGIRAGLAYDRVLHSTHRVNGLLEPAVNPFLSPEEAKRLPVTKRKAAKPRE